ncbi:TPA: hypothetical protein GF146_25445 [Escherichia coli]|nr:DUF3560 domain-containing protein [Escherichia coli]HAH3692131.1 hypothetical protein [Escherichia coli]
MTLAAITMTAPEAASPVQMYRATYSPDDNKLRLYAASRLDPETYKKVHDAGFRWAPKQALFVAPAWTPGREDVLLSLAGEIEDEDSTLAERQEARAERFTGYSGKRASESAQALDEVERLAAMIPPGQPILVGHHSERRARRDAQRIENGMKRAVMLFERAEYWEERARSALLHAKYKERPDVRWRRIKKIEADLRKAEKTIAQSQKYLTMWRAESLDLNMAKLISSHDHISACFPLDTYPRPAEKSQYEGSRSLWSALDDDIITTEQAREIAIRCHERQIQRQQRWVPGDAAERLFPSVRFRVRERSRHKSALVMQKYSRQQAREAEQKARAYQALVAQAEIELAFHSPETVGSWHARWSNRVAEHDLETLFWQWGERFPSLAGMERWQWQDMPFWQVIAEAGMAARVVGHAVREMERWMVPNKLREAA